ncbi:MAG: sugar ABC transporter permease [Candidatus Marinimicrobia bacterium]|nr:sugar ABC transporter permease [Candidatus Neomarinimicrobiota bacterium]|tara:strand:- start:128 stop:913 length:786 start_codon:yes stop_codon:yes gene_type:complete
MLQSKTKELFILLFYQEFAGKYRSSILGLYWIVITPLFMLTIYTFVFGYVFSIKWPGFAGSNLFEFSLILYSGLVFYNTFSEVISRSPTIVIENSNYVNKVVFPLELLNVIASSSAIINLIINLILIIIFKFILFNQFNYEILYLLFILPSFALMILGIAWTLSAVGVFIRDFHHLVSSCVQGLLFLSPIFYPVSSLPQWLKPFIYLNPITIPVEQARKVILFNELPDLKILILYGILSITTSIIGYYIFIKAKKGFSDVI